MGLLDEYGAELKKRLDWRSVTPEGLLGALRNMPLFDPKKGAEEAYNAGLNALTFAGVNAKTANKGLLAAAEGMEKSGADRAKILNDTGWFRGPDKKWRFEIDDSAAKLDFDSLPEGMSPLSLADWKLGEMPAYLHLKPGLRIGNPKVKPEDQSWALSWAKDNPRRPETVPIYKAMSHDDLKAAYGDLDGLKIGREDGGSVKGTFSEVDNAIRTGGGLIGGDKNAPRSTSLHELQHAIQQREGFARGGDEYSGAQAAWEQQRAVEKRIRKLENTDEFAYQNQRLTKAFNDAVDQKITNEEFARIRAETPLVDEWSKLQSLRRNSPKDGYDAYRRLAGEAESRAVQTRMDFSPDKRKAVPPWESYDIPWDQLIVR